MFSTRRALSPRQNCMSLRHLILPPDAVEWHVPQAHGSGARLCQIEILRLSHCCTSWLRLGLQLDRNLLTQLQEGWCTCRIVLQALLEAGLMLISACSEA